MFEAAVAKFVKTVGKESLVAVPSLDEANNCRPFQVVVKKNRRLVQCACAASNASVWSVHRPS